VLSENTFGTQEAEINKSLKIEKQLFSHLRSISLFIQWYSA
jgi:hypothetical protein